MALWDEVVTRVPPQRLVELTNAGTKGATTVDTDRADAAVTDTEADFEVYAQQAYDGADAKHVSAAVAGVILKLRSWLPSAGMQVEKDLERWRKGLTALAHVTSRARVSPKTSIVETPTPTDTSNGPVRPPLDGPDFDRVRTRSPRTGSDNRRRRC